MSESNGGTAQPAPRSDESSPESAAAPEEERWPLAVKLALIGSVLALVLGVFVYARGYMWLIVNSEGGSDLADPFGPLPVLWGLCLLPGLFAAGLLFSRQLAGSLCCLAVVVAGFLAVVFAGQLGHQHNSLDLYAGAWLGSSADRAPLAALWLIAAVPLTVAASVGLRDWRAGRRRNWADSP